MERATFRAAVFLVLIRDGEILLQRRFNTGWEDGAYSFVSGHVEADEGIIAAAIREAREEAGIDLRPAALDVVHVMYNRTDFRYINFFLLADSWAGEPVNMEPTRCDDLSWHPLAKLPPNLLPLCTEFLRRHATGTLFSEIGGSTG